VRRKFKAPPDYLIARRLARKGVPLGRIARRMGVSRRVLKRYRRRLGLLFGNGGFPRRPQPSLPRMRAMREQGDSYRRIGLAVGLDEKWVMRLLRRNSDDQTRV
jgi:hypothetical protein